MAYDDCAMYTTILLNRVAHEMRLVSGPRSLPPQKRDGSRGKAELCPSPSEGRAGGFGVGLMLMFTVSCDDVLHRARCSVKQRRHLEDCILSAIMLGLETRRSGG